MPEPDSFVNLMSRLQAADGGAAAEVVERFTRRLIALARQHLDDRLRQKVDAEDVLQSVFKSFFLRQRAGQWTLPDWDSLWALLAVITVRKCGQWADHFHAQRRDLGREAEQAPAPDAGREVQLFAREPTPSEVLILTETVERLLSDLEERDREIVTLALQGYTAAEISTQVNRPERTVYRLLARIKKRLQRQRARDDGAA
jgi:RNA polymerase sigma factor (sigma-70 family)